MKMKSIDPFSADFQPCLNRMCLREHAVGVSVTKIKMQADLFRCQIHFLLQNLQVEDGIRAAVKSICDAIVREAFSGIDLAGLLAASGYSEDYIRARFRQITGKTPHEYLTEIRIDRARFLIDVYGATLPLSEIAVRCGYGDYVYFSKKFKALTGLSPRQYREKTIPK